MRNYIIVTILFSILCGCVNTPSPQQKNSPQQKKKEEDNLLFDNVSEVISKLKVKAGIEYISTFHSINHGFGSRLNTFDSEFGVFYLFKVKTATSWLSSRHAFFGEAMKSFSDSCPGEVDHHSFYSFEEADKRGLLNPLNYTSEDKLKLMKELSTSWRPSDEPNGESMPYYLNLNRGGMINKEKKMYRSLGKYNHLFLENPNVVGDEYYWKNNSFGKIKDAYSICYVDGKVRDAIIYYAQYYKIFERGREYEKPGSHAVVGLYIPPETANNVAEYVFDTRSENVLRQVHKEEQKKKKEMEIYIHNKYGSEVWNNRFNITYTPGDKVCSTNNQMGYIEIVNERNIKVLFKGTVKYRKAKFFFGEADTHPDIEFSYNKTNEVTWVTKADIAPCNFKRI
jgi:hypothetical protein